MPIDPKKTSQKSDTKPTKPKASKPDALAVHGQYQGLIDAVGRNNSERLGVVVQTLISQADEQAEQLADVIETLASGHAVFNLTMAKLNERREFGGDCPESFRPQKSNIGIDLADLASDPFASVRVFPSVSTAKAIAGV